MGQLPGRAGGQQQKHQCTHTDTDKGRSGNRFRPPFGAASPVPASKSGRCARLIEPCGAA
eukprot:2279657-Alexandrium_andersonii.AAC.2